MRAILISAAFLATTALAPAHAATPIGSDYTFSFSGACTDCSGNGVGSLSVKNYILGTSFSNANFVSFSYSGTNLYQPYTIQSPVNFFFGSIGSASGTYDVSIGNNESGQPFFVTGAGGNWRTGTGGFVLDYGTAGTWTPAVAAQAVPEPATWAMFIGGFGLIGAGMRRRQRVNVRYA